MGQRHLFNTSPMFETDHDRSWNYMCANQPYVRLDRAAVMENNSLISSLDDMSIDVAHSSSHWNPPSRSSGDSSSNHRVDVLPHHQPDSMAPPLHDFYLHSSATGSHSHHASSSASYDIHTFKRKSPAFCERGSSSQYYNPESSQVKQETNSNLDCQNLTMVPIYRGHGLSGEGEVEGEGSMRNVRSRSELRHQLSSNPSHHPYSASNTASVDVLGQSANVLTREWSQSHAYRRILRPDSSGSSHETTNFLSDDGTHHHDFTSTRNPFVPQNLQSTPAQSTGGVCGSSYTQKSALNFRASSSNMQLGHGATSDESFQLVAENHSSRHPRPRSSIGWCNSNRHGRSRTSDERYRSLSDEVLHHRIAYEGMMIVDRSALYETDEMFDQHINMRLDVDNMSYEELLALGERIGNVSTGLSEDLISKCLVETIYYSLVDNQEEGRCVICLEEYKNMDDVGTLKTCLHDYHVCCIKKWLLMKNLCPICKAPAEAETTNMN